MADLSLSNPLLQLQGLDPSQLSQQTPSLTPQQTNVQQVPGPLGSHGFLGGLLGILGDAALSSMGLPAQYLPRLQNAREADAVSGYATDPQGAIQNLSAVAGVPTAQAFEDNQSNDAYRKAMIRSSQIASQIAMAKAPSEIFAAQQPVINQYKQLAATANPNNASAITSLITSRLPAYGIDPGSVGFPTSNDPKDLAAWSQSEMNAEQLAAAQAKSAELAETAHNAVRAQIAQQEANAASTTAGARSTEAGVALKELPSNLTEKGASANQANARAAYFNKLAATKGALMQIFGLPGGEPIEAPAGGINIIHYDAQGNRIP